MANVIDKPGDYVTRNGRKVAIAFINEKGYAIESTTSSVWHSVTGTALSDMNGDWDIVGPWVNLLEFPDTQGTVGNWSQPVYARRVGSKLEITDASRPRQRQTFTIKEWDATETLNTVSNDVIFAYVNPCTYQVNFGPAGIEVPKGWEVCIEYKHPEDKHWRPAYGTLFGQMYRIAFKRKGNI